MVKIMYSQQKWYMFTISFSVFGKIGGLKCLIVLFDIFIL